MSETGFRARLGGRLPTDRVVADRRGRTRYRVYETKDLPDHVDKIGMQIWKSRYDPRMQQLAKTIVQGEVARVRFVDDMVWEEQGRDPFSGLWVPGGSGRFRVLNLQTGAPCGPGDHECEILRCFNFVKRNLVYREDPPDVDLFMSAGYALFVGSGDCDDHTGVHCTLLSILGYTVGCEVISTNGSEWEHIYAFVGLPKKRPTRYVALDTAAPKINPNPVPGWRLQACQLPGAGRTCSTHRWTKIFKFA